MNDPVKSSTRKPRSRHRDLLAAIASGFVGALALATSTYNVYLQRQQVRADVWPRIAVHTDYGDSVFSIALINRGVGPAEVRRVRVTVDSKPAADWYDAERMLLRRSDFNVLNAQIEPIEKQVLSPGLEFSTFKVQEPRDAFAMFWEASRLATEVCYCSSLGDCWLYAETSALEPGDTRPIAECTSDPKPFVSATPETMANLRATFDRALRSPKDAGASDARE